MATRTVSNTGGNWNTAAAWVGGVVPIAGDDVNFTATSGNLTVNVSTANLIGITFATYVGTITFNNNINTSGTVNLGTGGYTQAGASGLNLIGTTTLTSGGVTWSRTLTFAGTSITYTLSANWTQTGTLTFGGTTATTINGNTLNIGGNLTSTTTSIVSGTTSLVFNGTGTWSNSSTGAIRNNLTVNTAGTITISGNVYYSTGILTYTAGTVVTTGSTLNIIASTTLNTNGISWNNISTSTSLTITLGSNLTLTGTLTVGTTGVATLSFVLGGFNIISSSANLSVANSNTFTVPQNLIFTNVILDAATILNGNQISILGNLTKITATITTGTTTLVLAGTGTWSNSSAGAIRNNLTVNTAGTITISGNVYYNTGILTYTAGTVVTAGSTLICSSSTTFATSGMTWNNATLGGTSQTYTNSTNMNIGGVFTINGQTTTILNGSTINTTGITFGTNGSVTSGTTSIVFNGTGTWTTGGNLHTLRNNVTVNTAGTLTISGIVYYDTGIFTYTAGTLVTAGSTLVAGLATTFNTGGMSWNGFQVSGTTYAITMQSNLNIAGTLTLVHSGTLSFSGAFTFNPTGAVTAQATITLPNNITITNFTTAGPFTSNGNTINITGNLTNSAGGTATGTTLWVLAGTGTVSYVGTIRNNLTINTAGTITVSGTLSYDTGTLTYTAGTVIVTGSTLSFNSSVTLNTSGTSWNNVTVGGTSPTVTLLSNLNIGGTLTLAASSTSTLTGNTINTAGLTITSNAIISGTSSVVFNGTGTWTTTGGATGTLRNNTTINTAGTLTISGVVYYNTGILTYTAGTVITTGSTLIIGIATTLNTNGIIWNNITTTTGIVITLTSNLTLTGTLSLGNAATSFILSGGNLISTNANLTMQATNTIFTMPANQTFKTLTVVGTATINGNTLTITENLTINASLGGTTSIVYAGTGTWSALNTSCLISNILTINTAGILTISGIVYKALGLFTYTAGTIIDTTGTVAVQSLTLNLSGFTFRKLLVNNTITLSSNINATTFGTWGANNTSFTLAGNILNFTHLELGNSATTTLPTAWTAQNIDFVGPGVLNGNSITITGNLTQSGALGYCSGTTNFIYAVPALFTGTWSRPSNGIIIANNITINSAGTINFTGGIIAGGIFTYTSGTFNVQVGSTLYIYTSNTINGAGIIWYNVTLGAPFALNSQVSSITLNTQLICLGTLSIDASTTTFGGSNGTFDTYNFVLGTDAITLRSTILVSTKTYRVRQSFTCIQATNASRVLLRSSIAASQAIFTVDPGATIDVGFVNATDINSSLGKKIYSYKGVFSNTLNWGLLPTDPFAESSSVFVN